MICVSVTKFPKLSLNIIIILTILSIHTIFNSNFKILFTYYQGKTVANESYAWSGAFINLRLPHRKLF